MLHYRKTYEVIGYAYEADLHCLECTGKRFKADASVLDFTATDSEDNEVHPIFLGDEHDTPPHCVDCFTRLDGDDDPPPDDESDDDDDE